MLELFKGQQAELDKKKSELDGAIEAFKAKHGITIGGTGQGLSWGTAPTSNANSNALLAMHL
jgi:hypothetical protein